MPAPNPYTFPLVPLTALPPEQAARSGMGGWDEYGIPSPSDRLLPFVFSRRIVPSNSNWLNCAWINNADTGARIATLLTTGPQVGPTPTPDYGIEFSKLIDTPNQAEYFTYNGSRIPALNLPCGVPLRLIVENAYQSPVFYAVGPFADLPAKYLLLEWFHPGPLQGVPYGRGFRQRFYLENGAAQYLDPREVADVTKDPDSGAEVTLSLAQYAQRQFNVGPIPAYLAEALTAARAVRYYQVDTEPYKLLTAKATAAGPDGGRWSVTATIEGLTPLLSRGCDAALLPVEDYDQFADQPRGYRCGDTSDKDSDFRPTGAYSCELDPMGKNTGYLLRVYQDYNPYSPAYGQQQTQRTQDLTMCPLPLTYQSVKKMASATRNNCQPGYLGSTVVCTVAAGAYQSNKDQDDADKQAQDAANAGAQANANANGTCQVGRRVSLANINSTSTRRVQFDVLRTDTDGDCQVSVTVQFLANDGQGDTSMTSSQVCIIPDGSNQLLNQFIPYGHQGAQYQQVYIDSVIPQDYQF